MSDDVKARIDELVKNNEIVLFMKGTPSMPMCGFSQLAAGILNATGKPFESIDVIGQPEYRQAVKDYGNWPTIPQLYVGGELLGGSDIVRQMYESGELDQIIDDAFKASQAARRAEGE